MSDNQTPILVVDDNEMNRDMLSRRLARMGYTVDVAENGQQALDKVKAGEFALVLLDIMMPDISGYEVLEQLKAEDAYQDLPIIMISAVDDLDSVVRCIELGAEDYLFKPFNPVLLRARVRASLDKHHMRQRQQHLNLHTLLPHVTVIKDNVETLLKEDAENEALQTVQKHVNALAVILDD